MVGETKVQASIGSGGRSDLRKCPPRQRKPLRRATTNAVLALGSAATILAVAFVVDASRIPGEQRAAPVFAAAISVWEHATASARLKAGPTPSERERSGSSRHAHVERGHDIPPRAFRPPPPSRPSSVTAPPSAPSVPPRSPVRVAAVGSGQTPSPGSSRHSGVTSLPASAEISTPAPVQSIPSHPEPAIAAGRTGSLEVVLVLDTSDHVTAERQVSMQRSARDLVSRLMPSAPIADRAQIALVPFAAMVNVGPELRSATWLDDGVGAQNALGQASNSRFSLYDRLGVAWPGCVEARRRPHDISVALPDRRAPATLFVPAFAPDEPDVTNSRGYLYTNNYLADDGGSCRAAARGCALYDKRGRCQQSERVVQDPVEAQTRLCKYTKLDVLPQPNIGPGAGCTASPMIGLGTSGGDLDARIAALSTGGDATIVEGLMWGWRLLDPATPIGRARPYGAPGNKKVIVLMTAGRNSYPEAANHNGSGYGAYGYAAEERLGLDRSAAGLAHRLDSRFSEACEAAKASGVRIVTVLLDDEASPDTQARMAACASEPGAAHREIGGEALATAIEAVGQAARRPVATGATETAAPAGRSG